MTDLPTLPAPAFDDVLAQLQRAQGREQTFAATNPLDPLRPGVDDADPATAASCEDLARSQALAPTHLASPITSQGQARGRGKRKRADLQRVAVCLPRGLAR